MVIWCVYLWLASITTVLLVWTHGVHTCQPANTPSLVLAPTKIQCQSTYAVQRMLVMGRPKLTDCSQVFTSLDCWLDIQTSAANANCLAESPLKAWFNLIQGG